MLQRSRLLTLALCAALFVSGQCGPGGGGGSAAPQVSATLNAVPAGQNALLVVPPSGFVVNATFVAGSSPVDPATALVLLLPFGATTPIDISEHVVADPGGLVGVLPASAALAPGNYTLIVNVRDVDGRNGTGTLAFAVRNFLAATPPIGVSQLLWYDFDVDRDGDENPDFPADLEAFGLGSPAAPALAALVRQRVKDGVIDRLRELYWERDPNGLGFDPVLVTFLLTQPPSMAYTTRICVGGVAPGQPNLIGSILIDRNNANKASVECGNLPPTGLFPRGLLAYQGNSHFIGIFGPLIASLGGTPVGEDPLDASVLAPDFDPGSATPEEAARYAVIEAAISAFATALGTITAHETGHALGLVEPGVPGVGLFGGTSGANLAHNVEPDGSVPTQSWLMNAGGSFSFGKLADLYGNGPVLRALNHAYLRDRVVQDPTVTALLPPPSISGVAPLAIQNEVTTFTVTGSNFAATPAMLLVGAGGQTYSLFAETLLSSSQVSGYFIRASTPPGLYTLQLQNPDGQIAINSGLVIELLPY